MTKALPKEVKLGCKVKCVITGFTGIAFQGVELMSGSVQYAVQPPLPTLKVPLPGAIPDAINIDAQLLEFVDIGVSDRVTLAEPTAISLGNEVEDLATGVKGTAITKHTFINGCVYFHILPKQSKEQKEKGIIPDSEFVDCKRLKKISDGLAKKAAVTLSKPLTERTGGPMTRASRV